MNIPATGSQSVVLVLTDRVAGLTKQLLDRSGGHGRTGTLKKSSMARVRSPHGQRISCVYGVLWLTFDGLPVEYVLGAGQSIVCEHDAPLLIAALEEAAWRADRAGSSIFPESRPSSTSREA